MKSINRDIKHIIVEEMPSYEDMLQDVIYVYYYDIDHGVSIHKCMCGCGEQTVMPFIKKGLNINSNKVWVLNFINDKIDFEGSVGNYSYPCKSHYMIQKGQVKMF